MFDLMDNIGEFLPKVNYGPFMLTKPLNMAGLTELMQPFNHTALKNFTQLVGAMKKMPGAMASATAVNLQSNVNAMKKNAGSIITAATGPNKTLASVPHAAAKLIMPSAAGALLPDTTPFISKPKLTMPRFALPQMPAFFNGFDKPNNTKPITGSITIPSISKGSSSKN